MKLQLVDGLTFPAMHQVLSQALPQYKTRLLKNPVFKWDYIEVKRNAFVGVWVRIYEDKGTIDLINCIPAAWARALFGGLIVMLFLMSSQKKLQAEIQAVLEGTFKVFPKK